MGGGTAICFHQIGGNSHFQDCTFNLETKFVTDGNERMLVEEWRIWPSVCWDMSSSALVWLLLYVVWWVGVCGGGGACTPSAFLYATMTALSRAVSPHQQPSIPIAQPKSRSKRCILEITSQTRERRERTSQSARLKKCGFTMLCCERSAKS